MAKGKKAEEKPKEVETITLDVKSFVRTRDSVVNGLATLQEAIKTLSSAYIKHTNACLGDFSTSQEIDSSLARLGDNPLLLGDLQHPPSPARSAAADAAPEKKERKKRQHDPNAPKRPLTPFFLYMQTARPIITQDLGPEAAKGAVSTEGTRRWGIMDDDDKQLWTNAYKDNLRLYNARMHSYKSGTNPDAKDMTELEAAAYADEHNIGADAASANAQLVGEANATVLHDTDAEGEPEKEPTPPIKTPKGKGTRKSKATPVSSAPEPIVPAASIVPPKAAPAEKEKSPDKKRKRGSKKTVDESVGAVEKEELQVETPKSGPKPRKKKTKADS
ncbi:High mobility group protein [Lachnellula hyalina]|uniref:High mobility group protein n=1 Tax=Lachnellula hyalina TaxID=1316788 RepID=A0A8H8R938_9HELO|nr:High mobility group protein [Lachnellula hyalina]TVY29946.1 High mobility group protein [Lachnellula hyalina]